MTMDIHSNMINLIKTDRAELTAEEYLKLLEDDPDIIKSARIAPPDLGADGFGMIHVEYTHPVFKAAF